MSILIRSVIFSIFFTLYGLAHWYVWARLVRDPRLPPWAFRTATAAIILFAASLPVFMIGWRLFYRMSYPVLGVAMVWNVVILYAVLMLGATDLARGVATIFKKPDRNSTMEPAGAGLPDESRRLFFTRSMAAATAGFAVALVGAGVHGVMAGPGLFRRRIGLGRLPKSLSGLSVAQISDLHVGRGVDAAYVRRVVARVNALSPDLVVITGDLVDGPVSRLGSAVAELGRLRSKYGTFFVPGNHDYYAGLGPWIRFLREMKVKVLMNEHVRIGSGEEYLVLAGVDDKVGAHEGGGPNVAQALQGVETGREVVLLAHRPGVIFDAEKHGVGLMLCGHTHGGGQVWPFTWMSRFMFPFVADLGRQGKTWIYVNRGSGWVGPPVRIGAPSEITFLTLVPEPQVR